MEQVTEGFVRGRDVFERMNYLYQLSEYWSKKNVELSAHYTSQMVSISKKSVLRLDRSIKRTVCKGCGVILSEGQTAKSTYTKKYNGQVVRTCNRCGVVKRFPCNHSPKKE